MNLNPMTGNELQATPHIFPMLLRMVASALIAPLLLAVALIVFLAALADFTWFRLRETRAGAPQPKGLWEF